MAHGEPQRDDPYQVLGVMAGASMQDIARAYRRAALAAHPDAQPADPGAPGRFLALTEAYTLLSDPGRRAAYDRSRSGHRGVSPGVSPPRSAQPAAGTPHQAVLWAGPVHIEPSPGRLDLRLRPRPADLAEPAELLRWYLRRIWGWPS